MSQYAFSFRFFLCALVGVASAPSAARAQTCTEDLQDVLTEEFDQDDFRDDATTASGWRTGTGGGVLRLSAKASTFTSESRNVGDRIFAVGAADFNNDGLDDLIGQTTSPCAIRYMPNLGVNSDGDHLGFDFGASDHQIDVPDSCNISLPIVVVGDYTGDDLPDILWLTGTNRRQEGVLSVATLYRNTGTFVGDIPQFAEVDVFADLNTRRISWHWSSGIVHVEDWNNDGFDDLLITTSYGTTNEILLYYAKSDGTYGFDFQSAIIPTVGTATPIADYGVNHDTGDSCPGSVSGGLSTVTAGDYDADGDLDLITCSLSEERLIRWEQDSLGNWTQGADIAYPPGGCNQAMTGDFDADGDLDIAIARDGWTCNGGGGWVHIFFNDGTGEFIFQSEPVVDGGRDLDLGVVLDIDNDPEGQADIIAADGNDSGQYYQVIPASQNIFTLEGQAFSTTLTSLTDADAISSIIVDPTYTTPTDTTVDFYVSNNDGATWELLDTSQLDGVTPHEFSSYGNQLRFRVDLAAEEDTLTGDDVAFAPASLTTPEVTRIRFSYYTVDRLRYSRSSVAVATNVDISGSALDEVVFAASFFYPGFEAEVRAIDVSSVTVDEELGIVRADNSAPVPWNAGTVLSGTPTTDRKLYVSYADPDDGDQIVNDKIELLTANLAGDLGPLINATSSAEAEDVVNFVRGGMNHPSGWKFFDVGHSSPVYVAGPSGDPDFFGTGYQAFADAQENRKPVVYIGANDGFVRAFDVDNGKELWGVVPNNLAGKLKRMRAVSNSGDEVYVHEFLVDGTLVPVDVRNSSGDWRTVLIAGQAQGLGAGDSNYYFAMDVTDPENPLPMWEFTDNYVAPSGASCDGDPCETTCTDDPAVTACNTDCSAPTAIYEETSPGSGVILIEAEDFASTTSLDAPAAWTIETDTSDYRGSGYLFAGPNDDESCSEDDVDDADCGALVTYAFTAPAGTYELAVRSWADDGDDNSFHWGIDNNYEDEFRTHETGDWLWEKNGSFDHGGGEAILYVWFREDGFRLDQIALFSTGTMPASGFTGTAVCEACTTTDPGTQTCTSSCVSDPDNDEWPECGVGAGLKCCDGFCIDVADACTVTADTSAMGETWSQPAVGRVQYAGATRWLTFFGSGYQNIAFDGAGRSVYAVDTFTGELVAQWDVDDIPDGGSNPSTLSNTIPGGIALVDTDDEGTSGYGYVDRLYFGDLEGRLYKIDLSLNGTAGSDGLADESTWPLCTVFDAGDPEQTGTRVWAPIVTTPGVALLSPQSGGTVAPTIYFGTGGDDNTPTDVGFHFYAVRDDSADGACASAPKRRDQFETTDNEFFVATDPNFKFWTNPRVVGDAVYVASIQGQIESVNPCSDISGGGFIYGLAIESTTINGFRREPGESVLFADNAFVETFATTSKIRTMPTTNDSAVNAVTTVKRPEPEDGQKIYFRNFASDPDEDTGILAINAARVSSVQSVTRILRWREIPLGR
ncbi:MAG: PilC/PilY family type IV pilus protein [Myxococcota bacterium]